MRNVDTPTWPQWNGIIEPAPTPSRHSVFLPLLICAVIAVAFVGLLIHFADESPTLRPPPVSAVPVSTVPPEVARIRALTSCSALQREFDNAMNEVEARRPLTPARNAFEAVAEAALHRATEIGCYR